MKKAILFCPTFELKNIHYFKDVGIIIESLCEKFFLDTYIITKKNEQKYTNYKSKIIIVKNIFFGFITNIVKLKPNYLIMFHPTKLVFFYMILFKILNPFGRVYIKSDIYVSDIVTKRFLLFLRIFSLFGYISFENKDDFNLLNGKFKTHVYHIPNGINVDSKLLLPIDKKENIILTVGRLGTHQKNTQEFLLITKEILNRHPKFKAVLIGEIEDETGFNKFLNNFFLDNSGLKDRIIFTGNINQKEVFSWYNKSMFFLLPSRFEGFACSLPEAAAFGNIIVARKVGGAVDITNNGLLGCIYDSQENAISYLETLILDHEKFKQLSEKSIEHIKQNYTYDKITNNIYNILIS